MKHVITARLTGFGLLLLLLMVAAITFGVAANTTSHRVAADPVPSTDGGSNSGDETHW